MLEIYQKTLSEIINFEGVGLHSGKTVNLKILPSAENSGVIFKRTDIEKNNVIKADFRNVASTKLCTTLENSYGVKISTVEHLLAAIYISGIDNAIIEVNNFEIPIMDGSAKIFLEKIKKQKLKTLKSKRKYLKILNKISLFDGTKEIEITPNNFFEVDFQLNFKNQIIGKQRNLVDFESGLAEEIYSSRTFCLFEDIEAIKKMGLAKGGTLDNAVVVNNEKVLNKEGLRNPKEFVNHKILDLTGDFLLSGYRIVGKVKCKEGGHELSNKFLKEIFRNPKSFSIVSITENKENIETFKKSEDSIALAATA